MTRDELQKTVHQVLKPFLFEPNTNGLRAEMVEALEDIGEGVMAEDRTTGTMVDHGAVEFHLSDGFKSYRVTYGPGYKRFQLEERKV